MKYEILDLGLVDYNYADNIQCGILKEVKAGLREDILILAEFFPVFTIGRSGSLENLRVSLDFLRERGIDFCAVERGGDITFHNPGQIVLYPIFNLSHFKKDIDWYLRSLEEVIINTLLRYGIYSGRRDALTGVWTEDGKIASIGIAVSKWTTYHGLSLNVNNDLHYFNFINPCGIKDCQITSISKLKGCLLDINAVKKELVGQFRVVFGVEANAELTAFLASKKD